MLLLQFQEQLFNSESGDGDLAIKGESQKSATLCTIKCIKWAEYCLGNTIYSMES